MKSGESKKTEKPRGQPSRFEQKKTYDGLYIFARDGCLLCSRVTYRTYDVYARAFLRRKKYKNCIKTRANSFWPKRTHLRTRLVVDGLVTLYDSGNKFALKIPSWLC